MKEAVEDLGSIWLELRGFANVTSVFTGKKDARTQIVAMPEEFVVVCGRNIIQYRFGKTLACVCVCACTHKRMETYAESSEPGTRRGSSEAVVKVGNHVTARYREREVCAGSLHSYIHAFL